jgi:hypothetical protein
VPAADDAAPSVFARRRLACKTCGLSRYAAGQEFRLFRGRSEATDPYFGLPLWLQTGTRHGWVTDPRNPAGIRVGDIYEDCSFHPVLCTEIDDDGAVVLSGISLIDGTFPRSCDAQYCAPVRIPVEDVMAIKNDLPAHTRRRQAELRAVGRETE